MMCLLLLSDKLSCAVLLEVLWGKQGSEGIMAWLSIFIPLNVLLS